MSSHWLTVIAAALAFGLSDGSSDTTAFPDIPKHLLECYMNDGIYHKANRFPNTYESFLDLIRKVEGSETSRNMNARELSLVLLHYLKLDGIQSIQTHAKTPSNILPFAPSGDEYFKHRLTLVGLVTRIDQSYLQAINESLHKKEMCNLHFMLSYSIDPYKRENERCTQLYEDVQLRPEPRSEWNPYQGIYDQHHPHRRYKRHFEESDRKGEVESISLDGLGIHRRSYGSVSRDKFSTGGHEFFGNAENRYQGLQTRTGTFGGKLYPRMSYSDDGTPYSGLVPGIPISDCPAVNGIITTPYGSLSIGTVIAGIAAGLNPEDIPPVKLSVDPSEMETQMDRVNNIWATTLAGTVADTLSSSALLDIDNLQILKGGWNDTASPKWYLLRSNQIKHITEVALRGSLDGLYLGLGVKELTSKYSNFKLSQLLQTYYEYSWGNLGAKYRVQMRPQYAPDEVFRKQVRLMSMVLKRQKTNVLTVLDFNIIAREAVSQVNNFIQNMGERHAIANIDSAKIDAAIDMVAVIDSGWSHEDLFKIFDVFRSAGVAATPDQSNLTIVCGSDGRILLSADNSLTLNTEFTKDMLYENCSRGMNYLSVFDSLDFLYRKIYKEEQTTNKIKSRSQVVVLMPNDHFIPENQDYIIEKSLEFQNNFRDVRLMVAANGRTDVFNNLLKNQKDIFAIVPPMVDPNLKTVKEFSEEVKQSFQRLSRPSCGSYFDDYDVQKTEVRLTRDVFPGGIVYYRLMSNYFFTSYEEISVLIRSKQRTPITVCHSREVERPAESGQRREDMPRYPNSDFNPGTNYNSDYSSARQSHEENGPVRCKTITSETYKIELSNPCSDAYSLDECSPLYVSLQPQQQPASAICPTCRLPFNVQYEISVAGLTCYNSAKSIAFSPFILFSAFVVLKLI